MLRTQPLTLEKLALEAICSYTVNVGQHLTNAVCNKTPKTLLIVEEKTKNEFNLSWMGDFLYSSLPRVLVPKMVLQMLVEIVHAIDRTKCTVDGFKTTGDRKCECIIKEMIIASIGPFLTSLDLSQYPHLIRETVCENLQKIQMIDTFTVRSCDNWKYAYKIFIRDFPLMQNLISFNMESHCTDEIVEILVQNCTKLKRLDVTGAIGISDSCIASILKAKHLEQLQLSATTISEVGFIQLWKEMAKVSQESEDNVSEISSETKGVPLKSLGCSFVRNTQLEILSNSFPFLTHICLCTLCCDLSILKCLKHLNELKLTSGHFAIDNLKGLLEERGSSFLLLDLMLIQEIDLMLLGKCCDKLKVLNLRSCSFNGTVQVSNKKNSTVPFQNLEHLIFYVQCSYDYLQFILLNSTQIETITVGLIKDIGDMFMESVLSKNPMKKLEQFKVYYSSNLTLSTVKLLMRRCPHLSCVGLLNTWEKISKEECQNFCEYLKKNNLALHVISKS